METSASDSPASPSNLGVNQSDSFSPVTVHMDNALGALFLGITTLVLFIALMRAEARNRALAAQLAASHP